MSLTTPPLSGPAVPAVPVVPAAVWRQLDWRDRIGRVLAGEGLRTAFQPIVDLRRATVVGYEALCRFDVLDGPDARPDVWFQRANELGLGAALDAASVASALRARSSLPRSCFLTVNVDPESLLERALWDVFAAAGDLRGLVIEITEHRPWDWASMAPSVERLRANGAMFAVDDAGAGYSGLQQILELRPSILKLDRSLVEGIDGDEAKVALIEMLGSFANRLDAWVLAEGVETAEEARRLAGLEVPLAQGFYFNHPSPPWVGIHHNAEADLATTMTLPTGSTLHHLVVPVPAIGEDDEARPGWADTESPWIPVVDGGKRPLGVVDPLAALSGHLVPCLVANVNSSPMEVMARLSTGPTDPSMPVVVVDNAGRYLGLVPLRRLLGAAAGA